MTVHVLSTMEFGEDWLGALAGEDARVEILEIPAERADELPDAVLREVEVMYTSLAFPTRKQAPRLRWVQLDTSGADHVRGTPVWENGAVTITSIGGVSPRPTVEYVLAMVLGFAHRLPNAARMRTRRHWPTHSERWELYGPLPVRGSRMAIVGYGRIGRGIARSVRAFGIEVVGVSRTGARTYEEDVEGVEVVSVEEDALLAALDSARLAGAALDVFESEPLPAYSPLWDDWRLILMQHIAGLACDYRERVLSLFEENLARYLAGEPLVNVIDRRLGY